MIPLLTCCVPVHKKMASEHRPLHQTAFQVALLSLLQMQAGAWRVPHQISNFTPFSGMVFVKNAAPMVDSCRHMSGLHWQLNAEEHQAHCTLLCPTKSSPYALQACLKAFGRHQKVQYSFVGLLPVT